MCYNYFGEGTTFFIAPGINIRAHPTTRRTLPDPGRFRGHHLPVVDTKTDLSKKSWDVLLLRMGMDGN